MSTSSDSSELAEVHPTSQHFTLQVNEEGSLSICLQRLNVESFQGLHWSHDATVIAQSSNCKTANEDDNENNKNDIRNDKNNDDKNIDNEYSANSNHANRYKTENDIAADNEKHLKSTKLIIANVQSSDAGVYECQVNLDGRLIKRNLKITQDVLERLIKNKGSVLNKKGKLMNDDLANLILNMPRLSLPGRSDKDSEEEDDDVVMELPRIPSRIFSRAGSVEDDDLRTGLSSPLLQNSKIHNKRIRRDSDSSDQGDNNDDNEDQCLMIPQRRFRRMSSIDISKSAQQRLIKTHNNVTSPGIRSPEEDSPTLNPDIHLYKQKLIAKKEFRRISLADIVPDWPKLERPVNSFENHSSSGFGVNKLGLPHIKADMAGIENQQVERRKSFSVRSRRTSLAEVIPDWPQLQKPKFKLERFLDDLDDTVVSEKDSRVELSCRFSKSNCKFKWLKDNSEIFHGQKYNFLQDDDGVIRLIIQRLCTQDCGVYSCVVQSEHTTKATLTVEEVKVKYSFTKKMPISVKVRERKDLLLECVLNDSRGSVQWTKNDDIIEYTPGLYEISRRENKCILRIPNVEPELDGAKFECSVYDDTSICHVDVADPEFDFVKRLEDQDAYEKEISIFECETNYRGALVKWLKNGKKITKSDERYQKKIKGAIHRLIIKKVETGDQAVYTCEVQSKSSSARLFVSPDLIIVKHLSMVSVLEHEIILLKTTVRNPKNLPAQWMKNDIAIDPLDDRRIKIENISNEEYQLSIKNACLEDAGVYACKWATRSTQADVVVKECRIPPSVDLDHVSKEIRVKCGKGIKIVIPYLGTPNPEARWKKDGKEIDKDGHIQLHQYDGKCVLTVDSSERKDEGLYTMTLVNDSGETSVDIIIGVIGPPSAPQAPLEVVDIFKHECHLRWNKPKDDGGLAINKYVVEVFDETEGKVTSQRTVKGDTQCSVDGLVEGHHYRFKVKACNSEGDSDWLCLTNDILAKDPWDPPSTPGKPMIKSCEEDMVEIEWKSSKKDGGSPILKYVLERRNATNDGDWQTVGMVPPTELCAVMYDLREHQQYEFRVVAVNKAGRGEWSEISERIEKKMEKGTEPDFDVPLVNTDAFEGSEIRMKTKITSDPWPTIKWYLNEKIITKNEQFKILENEESGVLELVIRQSEKKDSGVIGCELSNKWGNVTSYAQLNFFAKPSFKLPEVLIHLKHGESHKERLQFWNSGSYNSSFTCQQLPCDLHEDDYDDIKEKENNVKIISNDDNNNYLIFQISKASVLLNYKVYTVKLSNKVGADECTVKFRCTGCPGVCRGPINGTDVTKSSCTLSWRTPKTDGGVEVSHYEVVKRDQIKSYWNVACSNVKPSSTDTLSTTIENLVDGKEYLFKVAAVNELGVGKFLEMTKSIAAKLPYGVPESPGRPGVVISTSTSVTLSWSPVQYTSFSNYNEAPTTTYIIEKFFDDENNAHSISDDNKWLKVAVDDLKVPSNRNGECTCVVESLLEGLHYSFRVVAENQAGKGPPSSSSKSILLTEDIDFPVFKESLETRTEVLAGENLELSVIVSGSPKPSVTWYKDGQVIEGGGKYKEVGDEEKGAYRLMVKLVENKDADEYMVKAVNSHGSKSCRTQLIVQGAPLLQIPQMYQGDLVQNRGMEVLVKLYYSGDPAPSLTWSKDDKEIKFLVEPLKEGKVNVDGLEEGSILSSYRSRRQSVSTKLLRMKSESGSFCASLDAPPFAERSSFEFTSRYVTMKIVNAQAVDVGRYEVRLSNKYGEHKTCINLKINDVPEKPTSLTSTLVDPTNYSLTWSEPEEDGGSIVTSYYVEILQQQLEERWVPYVLSRLTKANIDNLIAGKTYTFRVGACNVFGKGPPSDCISFVAGSTEFSNNPEHASSSTSPSHSRSPFFQSQQSYSNRFSRSSMDRN